MLELSLTMKSAVAKLQHVEMLRLHSILKLRRHYDVPELMTSYKARVLSYLEYRTPAIYHGAATLLEGVNAIQKRFLREIGMTPEEALMKFHSAPLTARRDMAMLGIIHRSVLGLGPDHFNEHFIQISKSKQIASQKLHAAIVISVSVVRTKITNYQQLYLLLNNSIST